MEGIDILVIADLSVTFSVTKNSLVYCIRIPAIMCYSFSCFTNVSHLIDD